MRAKKLVVDAIRLLFDSLSLSRARARSASPCSLPVLADPVMFKLGAICTGLFSAPTDLSLYAIKLQIGGHQATDIAQLILPSATDGVRITQHGMHIARDAMSLGDGCVLIKAKPERGVTNGDS